MRSTLALSLGAVILAAGCFHDAGGNNGGGSTTDNAATTVTWEGTVPTSAAAGSNVLVCWRVEGSGTIAHTAVHNDTTSRANSNEVSAYKGAASYPNNATSPATGGYAVPGKFCTNVKMPATGTQYIRAHAISPKDNTHKFAAEKAITVGTGNPTGGAGVAGIPAFKAGQPTTGAAGSDVLVCWEVPAVTPGTIPHTAIHGDNATHLTSQSVGDYRFAFYPGNATAQVTVTIPGSFCTNVKLPTPAPAGGNFYLRAHAFDGTTNKLSIQEHVIAVT